jgi:hypothetical protein
MRLYGFVLAALAVLILGGKVLQAGWSGNAPVTQETREQTSEARESDREIALRWQQNRPGHWRAYAMQPR